jgi:DNA-binding transcriptional LysR family regulator
VLTPAAEQILPAATRLFDEAEAVFRLFGELEGTPTTTLRIAASDYVAKPLLVPVLRDLSLGGVPLHFEIATANSEEALSRLEHGQVDMAIVSFAGERPGMESRVLFEQAFYWVAPVRRGKKLSLLKRLESGEPLLRLGTGSVGRKLLERWLEQHGVRPRSTIDVPSVSLLLAYATGGVGIGLVPALPLEKGALSDFELERADVEPLPVKLVLRSGPKPSPAALEFIARLEREAARQAERLKKLPA